MEGWFACSSNQGSSSNSHKYNNTSSNSNKKKKEKETEKGNKSNKRFNSHSMYIFNCCQVAWLSQSQKTLRAWRHSWPRQAAWHVPGTPMMDLSNQYVEYHWISKSILLTLPWCFFFQARKRILSTNSKWVTPDFKCECFHRFFDQVIPLVQRLGFDFANCPSSIWWSTSLTWSWCIARQGCLFPHDLWTCNLFWEILFQ